MAQFTNQAQLTYNNSVTNSNVAVGELLEVLSATKTAVRNVYGQGDSVTYIVSIVNSGTVPFTGVTVTDNLGEYPFNGDTRVPLTYVADTVRYYNNGVLQAAPTVAAGPPLTISNLTVPAGGNATVIYEAETNQFAPLGTDGSIVNQVTVSGAGVTAITATETVTALQEPQLTITKSVSPVPVTENGVLTYTFLIQNTGNTPADAGDLAAVTDTFDPLLSGLSVSFNGASWTEGTNYNYNAITGLFSTVAGQITVPAASYTQDATTGNWIVTPGVSTLVVSGTV